MLSSTFRAFINAQKEANAVTTASLTPSQHTNMKSLGVNVTSKKSQENSQVLPEFSRLNSPTHFCFNQIRQLKDYYPFSKNKHSWSELSSAWIFMDNAITSIEQLDIGIQMEIIKLFQTMDSQIKCLDIADLKKNLSQAKDECQKMLVEQVKTQNPNRSQKLSDAAGFFSDVNINNFVIAIEKKKSFLNERILDRQDQARKYENNFTITSVAIKNIHTKLLGLDCARLPSVDALLENLKRDNQEAKDKYIIELNAIRQLEMMQHNLEQFEVYFMNALFLATNNSISEEAKENILSSKQFLFYCIVAGEACGFVECNKLLLDSDNKESYFTEDQANTQITRVKNWLDKELGFMEIVAEANHANDNLLEELEQVSLSQRVAEAPKEIEIIESCQKKLAEELNKLNSLFDFIRQSIAEYKTLAQSVTTKYLTDDKQIECKSWEFSYSNLQRDIDDIDHQFVRQQIEINARLALAKKHHTEIVDIFGNFSLKEKCFAILSDLIKQAKLCFKNQANLRIGLDKLKNEIEKKEKCEQFEAEKQRLRALQAERQAREALLNSVKPEDQEAYRLSKVMIDEHIEVLKQQLLRLFEKNHSFRRALGREIFPTLNVESYQGIVKTVDDSRCNADKVMNEIDGHLANPETDWRFFLRQVRHYDKNHLIEQKFLKYKFLNQVQGLMKNHEDVKQFITDKRTADILMDNDNIKMASEFSSGLQGNLKRFWQWVQRLFTEAKTKQCINPLLKCSFFSNYHQRKPMPPVRQGSAPLLFV